MKMKEDKKISKVRRYEVEKMRSWNGKA